MDITWLGHACFRLRGRDVTILTDPYVDEAWGYPPLSVNADVVTVSNDHPHHAGVTAVQGQPHVLRGPGEYEIGGALIWGIRTPRPAREDGERPPRNTAFVIQVEDLTVCHLGDLTQAQLGNDDLARIQSSDVLLVPVGGHCTIDAAAAAQVVAQVEPKMIVPMHYATDETRGYVKLEEIDKFCREMGATEVGARGRLSVTSASLPSEPTVVLLEPRRG